jgi:hypothetical protein
MSSEAHNFLRAQMRDCHSNSLHIFFIPRYILGQFLPPSKYHIFFVIFHISLSLFFFFLFLVQKWVGDNKINRFTYKVLGYFTSLLLARESICIGLRPLKCTFKHPWSTWRGGGEETRGVMWERQKTTHDTKSVLSPLFNYIFTEWGIADLQ